MQYNTANHKIEDDGSGKSKRCVSSMEESSNYRYVDVKTQNVAGGNSRKFSCGWRQLGVGKCTGEHCLFEEHQVLKFHVGIASCSVAVEQAFHLIASQDHFVCMKEMRMNLTHVGGEGKHQRAQFRMFFEWDAASALQSKVVNLESFGQVMVPM